MADDLDRYLAALPDKIRAELAGIVQQQAQMLSDAQRSALRMATANSRIPAVKTS